jgi:diguanylate cyclase (GGDEF)-like protein
VVTISLGVSSAVPGPEDSPADLLGAADRALYRAKEEGRNRIVI